jgi:hypothetical protein
MLLLPLLPCRRVLCCAVCEQKAAEARRAAAEAQKRKQEEARAAAAELQRRRQEVRAHTCTHARAVWLL